MASSSDNSGSRRFSRREFVQSVAAAGAGALLSRFAGAQDAGGGDTINVAIIGAGTQGRVLINDCLKIPEVRFRALCDIWDYSQRYGSRLLAEYGHEVNVYEDYREMLQAESDLDAVIVATPDWVHHDHAIACLDAGLHVYCEKEMSNTLENAAAMVRAQRRTGKLLQIGHQRRSNPRYLHALNNLIGEAHILGRMTHAYGQWNRAVQPMQGWPQRYTMDEAKLNQYGYETMEQFRNWRWFRQYGGGPIVDLGSHQIDIFNWFFGANPRSVMASGGADYYEDREWYDNVMAIYEFDTPAGTARAFYQVLTTTSAKGYFENFFGDQATLSISEDPGKCRVYSEGHIQAESLWRRWIDQEYLIRMPAEAMNTPAASEEDPIVEVYRSIPQVPWLMPVLTNKTYHQPHLENFFAAVRGAAELNCPAEVGYETAATVLAVNRAVEAARRIEFEPEDFRVE